MATKATRETIEAEPVFATILVPIDFSPCSLEAYRVAVTVARRYQASLLLLYVLDTRTLAAAERLGIAVDRTQTRKIRHRVRLAFGKLMDSEKGVKMRRVVVEGAPFAEIMRLARMEKVDLIVIGAYGGRSAELEKIFFGSTAEKVVRAAPCPVLCVPLRAEQAAAGAWRRMREAVAAGEASG